MWAKGSYQQRGQGVTHLDTPMRGAKVQHTLWKGAAKAAWPFSAAWLREATSKGGRGVELLHTPVRGAKLNTTTGGYKRRRQGAGEALPNHCVEAQVLDEAAGSAALLFFFMRKRCQICPAEMSTRMDSGSLARQRLQKRPGFSKAAVWPWAHRTPLGRKDLAQQLGVSE